MSAGWQLRLADGATQEAVARCDALCQLPTNHQGAKLGSLESLCKDFMASERFFDSKKKKHFNARYLIAHILTHEGHSSAVQPWLRYPGYVLAKQLCSSNCQTLTLNQRQRQGVTVVRLVTWIICCTCNKQQS